MLENGLDPRVVIDSIPQIVWSSLPDGVCDYVNHVWVRYTGLTDFVNWRDLVHPEDREELDKGLALGCQIGEPFEHEFRYLAPDKTYRWMLGQARPFHDADGNLIRWIGTATDISKQKDISKRLRQSEELFRLVTKATRNIVWEFDPIKDIVTWNDALFTELGYPPECRVTDSQWWLSKIHPDDLDRIQKEMLETIASGRSTMETEYRFRKADGSYCILNTRCIVVRDDNNELVRVVGAWEDVTRERLADAQLKESEKRWRTLTNSMSQIAWLADSKGSVTWCNDRWYIFTGLDPAAQPQPERTDFIHPDHLHRVEKSFAKALASFDSWTETFPMRGSDGEYRWFLSSAHPVFDDAGLISYWLGTDTDITDRVKAQEELKEAKNLAESANEAKTSFLANMSHEIRTPLGAILGFANLLKSDRYSAEERSAFVDTISRAGASLTRIIDDILDLSKIEAGRIELENVPVSLHEMLDECAALFSVKARSKGIAFACRIAEGTPEFICSDPTRIRQILLNLIGNAVKFTNVGSVEVHLETQRVGDDQVRVQFDVKDSGIGLSAEQCSRIFQPFTQADNSTTRKHGGTGLGLALSKRLARALGGDIVVYSKGRNAGCTFSLLLTASLPADGRPLSSAEPELATDIDLKGMRLLVAEDSPEIQFLLDNLLSDAGAEVEVVSNGRDAILKARGHRFDAILMDIQMPLVDGYEATKTIRSLGFDGTIIALTAHAMAEERKRTEAAGCDYHLTKPIRPGELLGTLKRSVLL